MPPLLLPRLVLSVPARPCSCPSWAVCPLGTLRLSVWILLQRSFLGCRLQCAPAGPRTRPCWHASPCLPGPPSVRGCSASALCLILPRRTCLHLMLFCTCPPLCAGALWPMPAWVWPDVHFFYFFYFLLLCVPCVLWRSWRCQAPAAFSV